MQIGAPVEAWPSETSETDDCMARMMGFGPVGGPRSKPRNQGPPNSNPGKRTHPAILHHMPDHQLECQRRWRANLQAGTPQNVSWSARERLAFLIQCQGERCTHTGMPPRQYTQHFAPQCPRAPEGQHATCTHRGTGSEPETYTRMRMGAWKPPQEDERGAGEN